MTQHIARVVTISLLVTIALSTLGVAYGLWTKTLVVEGTVRTGEVDLIFVDAFTDDDGRVDNATKDSQDDGGPSEGFDAWGPASSADPAASGRDEKAHYDKDVAKCEASIHEDAQQGSIDKFDVYPSYVCTAWFDIRNIGNIPVKIKSVTITPDGHDSSDGDGAVNVRLSETNSFDLDGDLKADVEIHVADIRLCQQIDPGEVVQMSIDQHILQAAEEREELNYILEVLLAQWNEMGTSDSNGDNICDSS